MFFRDVDNQFLDEVQSRNSFSNSFVVFVSGVHFIFNFTKRWTNAGSKLFKENFTEGITKEIVIKVFDRTTSKSRGRGDTINKTITKMSN